MSNSSLLRTPDLVLALPLIPEGHRSSWIGISAAGKVDVKVSALDENAKDG